MNEKQESGNFDQWAKVELMGHVVIVGRVTETSLAGGAFLRIDVPAFTCGKTFNQAFTKFVAPGAIYAITPVSEEVALAILSHHHNEPVSRFEMAQIADKVFSNEDGDES